MGLYPPVVPLPLCPSPSQLRLSKYGWVSTPWRVVPTRESSVFLPGWSKVWIYRTISGPWMAPYLPEVKLAQHSNPSQSEIRQWSWDFHAVREASTRDLGYGREAMLLLIGGFGSSGFGSLAHVTPLFPCYPTHSWCYIMTKSPRKGMIVYAAPNASPGVLSSARC